MEQGMDNKHKEQMFRAFREELGRLYFYNGESKNWTMMNYHYHDSCEILLTMCNNVTVNISEHSYTANKSDLFLIRSGEPHQIIPSKNGSYRRYVLMFYPEDLQKLSEAVNYDFLSIFRDDLLTFTHKITLAEETSKRLQAHFLQFDPLYANMKDKRCRAQLLLILSSLLMDIYQIYQNTRQISNAAEISRKSTEFALHDNAKDRIEQIKQYICDHIEEKLTLGVIAEKFYLSNYYLSHYFRKETGFSITQYITMQKLNRAKNLLISGKTITFVAMELGYTSNSHFISTFQRLTGTTPKRFVTEYQNSKNL